MNYLQTFNASDKIRNFYEGFLSEFTNMELHSCSTNVAIIALNRA